jgi:hypothetical protein
MLSHAARAFESQARSLRKSGGILCTAPSEISCSAMETLGGLESSRPFDPQPALHPRPDPLGGLCVLDEPNALDDDGEPVKYRKARRLGRKKYAPPRTVTK